MNSLEGHRGRHLTRATGLAAFTGTVFARGFDRIIARIDRGLAFGMIEGILPDGSIQVVGGRGPGPTALITIHSWKALYRLVSGLGGRRVEQPRSSSDFRPVHAQSRVAW
jgi:cyclopropane-fatty-acyl-phospholipid synthase